MPGDRAVELGTHAVERGNDGAFGRSAITWTDALEVITAALTTAGNRTPTVLIDGRSGAGKTSLARLVAERVSGAHIIRLDDMYPGWFGLQAARTQLITHLLGPRAAARPARWQRWNWAEGVAAEWVEVDPAAPLIVDGVGAIGARSCDLVELAVWIELDAKSRKRRALVRDGEVFARHWDDWAAQEDAMIAEENPTSLADVIVDGSTITQ